MKYSSPRLHNVLSTGTNIVKIWLSLCLIGCVSFARYFGKCTAPCFFPTVDYCACLGKVLNKADISSHRGRLAMLSHTLALISAPFRDKFQIIKLSLNNVIFQAKRL